MRWTVNRDGDAIWNAERSEVLKAVIMAGADRFTRNTSTSADIVDYRSPTLSPSVQSANGLDRRYGAGQVNIYNSYKILAAGEQNSSRTGAGDIGWRGFDYEPSSGIMRWPGR